MKYSVWAKGLEKMELHLHNVLSTRSLESDDSHKQSLWTS